MADNNKCFCRQCQGLIETLQTLQAYCFMNKVRHFVPALRGQFIDPNLKTYTHASRKSIIADTPRLYFLL